MAPLMLLTMLVLCAGAAPQPQVDVQDVKLTLSREEVEAAWQEATGDAHEGQRLSDADWRKFVLNARRHWRVDIKALLADCGVIGGSGKSADACSSGSCRAASGLPGGEKSAAQLHAEGFTAAEMRAGGAPGMKTGGYSAGELRAGNRALYSTREMQEAGFTAGEMKAGGWHGSQLGRYGIYEVAELRAVGFTASEIDLDPCALKAGGYALQDLKDAGSLVEELKLCYSLAELKAAGYSAGQMRQKQVRKLLGLGKVVKEASFPAAQLRRAGYTLSEMLLGGFTPGELMEGGYRA